jgi:signal transduction histidine kinase
VVDERFTYWAPLLEDQGRHTSLTLAIDPDRRMVRCSREDLVAAVDALLENAVAHTSEGTAVHVEAISVDEGWVRVDVRDRGPGVPESALQRGRSDRGSSGLGLDIARACAEASGGRLELVRDGEWSGVRLLLGPA